MNRRIQELAEQADVFADSKLQMKGEYHPDWHDLRDEKFAELIVRECAGVELYWLSEQDRKSVVEKIKQHFGVE